MNCQLPTRVSVYAQGLNESTDSGLGAGRRKQVAGSNVFSYPADASSVILVKREKQMRSWQKESGSNLDSSGTGSCHVKSSEGTSKPCLHVRTIRAFFVPAYGPSCLYSNVVHGRVRLADRAFQYAVATSNPLI